MTEQEFIDSIIDRYNSAKELLENNDGFNIVRGMAHSVAGYVEDLFAVYMAKKFNDKGLGFLVDKVISFKPDKEKRAKSFKPDLFVSPGPVMTHYFDVKTNLGWNRNLEKYLRDKNKFIHEVRGKDGWTHFHGDKPWKFTIAKKLIYQIVIISSININAEQLKYNQELANTLDGVEMYVLHVKNGKDDFIINQKDFDRLHQDSFKLLNL